jgi:hypothetical protein
LRFPASKPPDNTRTVIIYLRGSGPFTGSYSHERGEWRLKDVDKVLRDVPSGKEVTHWQDIPGRKSDAD